MSWICVGSDGKLVLVKRATILGNHDTIIWQQACCAQISWFGVVVFILIDFDELKISEEPLNVHFENNKA